MKFGVVNKSTILNRFVLHVLQRNFTHLAVITRKTNIKLVILKEGGNWKRAQFYSIYGKCMITIIFQKKRNNFFSWPDFYLVQIAAETTGSFS